MLILLSIFNIYKIMEVEMDKLFKLKENNTSVRTEVVAGITTFMTMAYILAVNPSILSASGMDSNAILMATAIASAIGCFAMAFLANYPFALAPGLGLNAYFAYTVCGSMGYSWKVALFAVFVEGLVFIVLSLTNVREAIFNAIPTTLKKGVSVGIGLFVAFIGLQGANLVVASESTKVTVVNFRTNFNTVGIGALLAVIGTFIIAILYVKHVKGSILIGIVATWVLGIICQLTGLYKVDAAAGFYSLIPSWRSFDVTAISLTFGQCFNLKGLNINILDFIVIMCSFLFVDMFDTLGTLIGVANKAKMLDENGRLPRIKQALLADAIATSAGAILGTSTTTTFVESSSGVAEVKRTLTYIGDICRTMLAGALSADCMNDVYNIGGESYSLRKMAFEVAKKYGVELEYTQWPDKALKIESGSTVFDSGKLDSILGNLRKMTFKNWIGGGV